MSDDLIKALQKEAEEDAEIITFLRAANEKLNVALDVCRKEANKAADETTRLRAELAAALAECERINKSRNRWGKKYNDCLGKLRLAVMSDSDECKELTAQNNNLRTDIAAVTEERDRMREALKPFSDAASTDDYIDDIEIAETDTARKITFGDIRRARAALEGVTEPASPWRDIESAPKDGTIIFVWDESSSPEIVAAYYTNDYWVYADQLLAEADPEGPIPTHWMPLPEPPR